MHFLDLSLAFGTIGCLVADDASFVLRQCAFELTRPRLRKRRGQRERVVLDDRRDVGRLPIAQREGFRLTIAGRRLCDFGHRGRRRIFDRRRRGNRLKCG